MTDAIPDQLWMWAIVDNTTNNRADVLTPIFSHKIYVLGVTLTTLKTGSRRCLAVSQGLENDRGQP